MKWRLELSWLRKPPLDFRRQLKDMVFESREIQEARLMNLANHGLDFNQLHSLYKFMDANPSSIASLPKLSLGIISNGTTKLLSTCLVATGLRYGLNVSVIEGAFDQSLQESIDSNSIIHLNHLDIILIALDHRGIPGLTENFESDEEAAVAKSIEFIKSIRQGLRSKKSSRLIFQTVPINPDPLFGSADCRIQGLRSRRINLFNQQLAALTLESGDLLLNVANIAASIGLDQWFDEAKWHIGKFSMGLEVIPLYADHCFRLLTVASGKNLRKCLVLDLDNTLWGGIIGDDGLSGIKLGQGSAEGEAYLAVQRMALSLRQRGIILAVCSKNEEAVARLPFQEHPDMLLRESDIAVFMANWRDKATNLLAIASALNISIDSLVFVDDNPAERQLVREVLPMVAVPELPEDPAFFPRIIMASGYFEAITFSRDDTLRAGQYQDNAKRALAAAEYRDLDAYLHSLEMKIFFSPFNAVGRIRISQLISRSNQFNLTTPHYSEIDIAFFENQSDIFTVQVRLTDKFGDNGMISVIICRQQESYWEIDTWLMSCRVLNRRVEEAVLDYLVQYMKRTNALKLIGLYIPTERNILVKDHYKKLNFSLVEKTVKGEVWELLISSYQPKNPPMMVIQSEEFIYEAR